MRPFSIYFPQFYPTETNDRVWGKGFTDWALLANANLDNRWERRAPRRGLYDGADPVVHHAQLDEMRAHGLGGLGLYHYWFFDHQELGAFESTLLRSPADAVLPWFLIWASEGWTKRWLGDHSSIVDLDRDPPQEAIERHCAHLAQCFAHPAYLRVGNRPVFVWYNLNHFSQPARLIERYREVLARHGVDMFIAHFVKDTSDAALCRHTDGAYLFEPRLFFSWQRVDRGPTARRLFAGVSGVLGEDAAKRLLVTSEKLANRGGTLHKATDFVRYLASADRAAFVATLPGTVQEVVSPGWNNAPRYARRFTALENLSADQFGAIVATTRGCSALPLLVNAWNEWTENAAIEPCAYFGTRYLDAMRAALQSHPAEADLPSQPREIDHRDDYAEH